MSNQRQRRPQDPRMAAAIAELKDRISGTFPGTAFAVQEGIDDQEETWLVATVDIDDPDAVVDVVLDRLLELQLDEQVPLHVLPIHTPERVARTLSRQRRRPVAHIAGRYLAPRVPQR